MRPIKGSLAVAAFVVAGTVGAGIFALPQLVRVSGVIPFLFYLITLGGAVSTVHILYWKTLERTGGTHGLLGLLKKEWGDGVFVVGLLVITGGLLLTLSAYLVLGASFVSAIFPISESSAGIIFWFLAVLPLILSLRKFFLLETVGTYLVVLIVGVVLILARDPLSFFTSLSFVPRNIFLPFGTVLFALAGWNTIETLYEMKARGRFAFVRPRAITMGTYGAALLYLLFVMGTFNMETSRGETILLSILGLICVLGVFRMIGKDLIVSLGEDLQFSWPLALGAVAFVPVFFLMLGLRDFLALVSLVGGVFVAFQYIAILFISKRILHLRNIKGAFVIFLTLIFAAGAALELYRFFT